MVKPKTILFIFFGLISVSLIFAGGCYFGQYLSVAKTRSGLSPYFHMAGGYGTIKDIDVGNSVITLAFQSSENKTLEAKITENSNFNQAVREKNGKLGWEIIGLKDLKLGDKVFFMVGPEKDGSFTLFWLNIESK